MTRRSFMAPINGLRRTQKTEEYRFSAQQLIMHSQTRAKCPLLSTVLQKIFRFSQSIKFFWTLVWVNVQISSYWFLSGWISKRCTFNWLYCFGFMKLTLNMRRKLSADNLLIGHTYFIIYIHKWPSGVPTNIMPTVFTARAYARAVLGDVILSVRPSVRPSVTRVDCDKTKWRTADIL